MAPRCYRHSWGHRAPQRGRDPGRDGGSEPNTGLGSMRDRLQGCGGPDWPATVDPALRLHGPPFPCLGAGRADHWSRRVWLQLRHRTAAVMEDTVESRVRRKRWPAPTPSVAGGARGWIPLSSMMPSSPDDRLQMSDSEGHFDLNSAGGESKLRTRDRGFRRQSETQRCRGSYLTHRGGAAQLSSSTI